MVTDFTLFQLDGDYGITVLLRLFQSPFSLQMTRSFKTELSQTNECQHTLTEAYLVMNS